MSEVRISERCVRSIIAAMEVGGGNISRTDMDNHADSPVVGKNAYIVSTQDKKVTINGSTKSLGSKRVPVADTAVAYDCEFTGEVYILIIRNALYFEEMHVNLISPFILCLADFHVNEEPKFMASHPTLDHHSISVPDT